MSSSTGQPLAIAARFSSADVETLLRGLAPRQWAFATALATTRVGQAVKAKEEDTMPRVLDRPTPFTQRSLYLRKATPATQQARVWFKDFAPKGTPAGKYLEPQVYGGERDDKRFERALEHAGLLRRGMQLVPASGAVRDRYGNVAGGGRIYSRILSQLQAQRDPFQNETARSRQRNRNKVQGRYFYGNPHGLGWGIWERLRGGQVLGGRMGGHLTPIFLESRRPTYRPRFAFFAIAENTAADRFPVEFNKAAAQTVATARR